MKKIFIFLLFFLSAPAFLFAATLEVGPGKGFSSIEKAYHQSQPGDVILIHPRAQNQPYEKVALFVSKSNITFKAALYQGKDRVKISGKGYVYSGVGRTPRAIFQFNKGADGCVVEGLELFEAHNQSHNGAGVRINEANHITILNCEIHSNDMGIMSNGDVARQTALHQWIVKCHIHHNGSFQEPGYNHNLYLGGTSVVLSACEIHSSLTGHNVKSRAHFNWVEYCYIHDSANREIDFVDEKNTEVPESHSVLLGNIIVKAKDMKGNRGVIHFGQDGGREHQGKIYLIHNTISTPYGSPILLLSAGKAGSVMINNIFWNGGTANPKQTLIELKKASKANVQGLCNWFSYGFAPQMKDYSQNFAGSYLASPSESAIFLAPEKQNFHPRPFASLVNCGWPWAKIKVPPVPGRPLKKGQSLVPYQYKHPWNVEPRPVSGKPDLGAYERGKN